MKILIYNTAYLDIGDAMSEEQAKYGETRDPLEVLRDEIETVDRFLEKLQREHERLTGRRYQWFK